MRLELIRYVLKQLKMRKMFGKYIIYNQTRRHMRKFNCIDKKHFYKDVFLMILCVSFKRHNSHYGATHNSGILGKMESLC